MTTIYRKNPLATSREEATALLYKMGEFVKNPILVGVPPQMDAELLAIWNGGDHLKWEWSEESQEEYDGRIAREKAAKKQLKKLKSDLEYFKNIKVRPWRNAKLAEWIDQTFVKPLFFDLTDEQKAERISLRNSLCDWPELFDKYVDDSEIDALKPSAPSWISV